MLKGADAHQRFIFITGVSKFSKVSLFSGLNNLNDITLDPTYSAICGDTDTVFAPELDGLDRDPIRRWYNGYNWMGDAVYNPFDLLLLFQKRQFKPYWFETGTPTFLVDLLTEGQVFTPDLARLPFRIQGCRPGPRRPRPGSAAVAGLRRKIPPARRHRHPHRHRVQPRAAQRRRV